MTAFLDYWITSDVKMNANVIDGLIADPGVDDLVIEASHSTPSSHGYSIGPQSQDGLTCQWHVGGPAYIYKYVGTVAADTWYTLEAHVLYDNTIHKFTPELFIDGVDQSLPVGSYYGPSEYLGDQNVYFGTDQINSLAPGDWYTYHRNIKIGTSRGAHNLFDGSSLSSAVIPPFAGETGDNPSASLSVSAGVLQAWVSQTFPNPTGYDYATAELIEAAAVGRHFSVRVG